MLRLSPVIAAFLISLSIGMSSYAQELLVDDENWDKRDIVFTEALESIIFPPNPRWESLSSFSEGSKYRVASSPVGRLKIKKSGGVSLCTGFLVGNGLILTNNHCISDDSSASEAIIEMGYYARMGSPKKYIVDVNPVLTEKGKDISLLRVNGSPEDVWGNVEFNIQDISPGEELFIIHHPGGQPKKVSRVGCFTGPVQNLRHGRFLHQCDTVGGSSGSPIFDTSGRVVGIHHRGTPDRGSDAYNQGTKFIAANEFIGMIMPKIEPSIQSPVQQDEVEDDPCSREINGVVVFDPKCRHVEQKPSDI